MVETVCIVLPWPNKALAPHAKGHWRPKARATKAAREEAAWLTKEQLIAVGRVPGPHDLRFKYFPPDRRRRDIANVHAMLKPHIDGIADALGVDDSTFRPHFPVEFSNVEKGGFIFVEIIGARVR